MIKTVVTVLLVFAMTTSYLLLDSVDVDDSSDIRGHVEIDAVTKRDQIEKGDPIPPRSRSWKTLSRSEPFADPDLESALAAPKVVDSAIRTPSKPPEAVSFNNGLLSIQVQRKPLVWVLEQAARAIQVSIINAPELSEELVSIEFRDLQLLDGLQRLLSPWDALFRGGSAGNRLQAVWVYPEGKGEEIAPIPASEWASTHELERGLSDADPNRRADALEALAARNGQQAADHVVRALQDGHGQVRFRALDTALHVGVELSADTIISLAQTDPLAELRVLALDRLSDLASSKAEIDIRPILENALNDSDQRVRYKARELLDAMTEVANHQDISEQG